MPSAAPVPRGPSVLLLGSAAGLLARPGCPACWYSAEASDSYLAWFALEGHGDVAMLDRLGASRGMCARHTRRMLAQPGAAARLSAVYKYVLLAARPDLAARPAECPACEHDSAAASRAVELLLDAVAAGDRHGYQQHGGLCLPHLRTADRRRGADQRWLIGVLLARLGSGRTALALLGGWPDPDAQARAAHRAALPWHRPAGDPPACPVCWAEADAERAQLTAAAASRDAPGQPASGLCPAHLHDAALAGGAAEIVSQQAERESERLAAVRAGRRLPGRPAGWPLLRAGRLAGPQCAVCRAREAAAAREIGRVRSALRDAASGRGRAPALCLRHVRGVRLLDATAGRIASATAGRYCGRLLTDLEAGWRIRVTGNAAAATGPEMMAWRRAAAFLDGGVFGGCPAGAAAARPGGGPCDREPGQGEWRCGPAG